MLSRLTRRRVQNKIIIRPVGALRSYAGTTDPLQAGKNLKVDALLDGTVQHLPGQTRVTVRLLDVTTGQMLWTGNLDESAGNDFILEDAISQKLAEAMTLRLTPVEQQRLATPHTHNSEAYDLYTRGRVEWNNRSVQSVHRSIELFQQAIQADPQYAAAYAGLADAYILAGSYGNSFLAPSVTVPRARQAVEKALALDSTSPEAHTSLAYLRLTYDWDWAGAESEFKEALRLNPAYVTAHHWYSHELTAERRVTDSHRESEEMLALAPTDVLANEHMAWHHLFARQYDAAIPQAIKAVEIDPNFVQAHRVLGLAYLYSGETAKACPEFDLGVKLSHEDPIALAYQARCLALSGRKSMAKAIAVRLENDSRERYISAAEIAAIYAALDDKATAVHWLNKAYEERASALIYINVDPVFDHMQNDPGFLSIAQRVLPGRP